MKTNLTMRFNIMLFNEHKMHKTWISEFKMRNRECSETSNTLQYVTFCKHCHMTQFFKGNISVTTKSNTSDTERHIDSLKYTKTNLLLFLGFVPKFL